MLTRRELLELVGLSTTYLLLHPLVSFSDDSEVFPHGVASGDPSSTGVVLWTRIEPKIHERLKKSLKVYIYPDIQGDPNTAVKGKPVKELEIPANYINQVGDYTVKFSVDGLEPGKTYFYLMEYDNKKRLGRFKTLPAGNVDSYKLVFITCQNYLEGYYGAFKHIAEEDVGFVLHLGDATYEAVYGAQVRSIGDLPSGSSYPISLADYRYIHRKYLSDPSYQKARAMHTFIYIWDDHEFANDYYYDYDKGYWVPYDYPQDVKNDKEKSLNFKKVSIKAWYEYIPSSVSVNFRAHPLEVIKIYRDFKVGNLFHLICTDERSYRHEQCPQKFNAASCPNPNPNTMLGDKQREWFFSKLSEEGFSWKLWANEVLFDQLVVGTVSNTDSWDGYSGERQQIIDYLISKNIDNLVILTGDLHTFIAAEVPDRFANDYQKVVAAEFMTGAISSANLQDLLDEQAKGNAPNVDDSPLGDIVNSVGNVPPTAQPADIITTNIQQSNPWLKFFNSKTWGYSVLEVNKDNTRCTFYSVNKYEQNPPKELLAQFLYKKGQNLIREK